MTATIQLAAVRKHFGATVAVDGIDWSADTGVIGVLGPNGAGKTTLLRMLATVLAPDDGSVRLFGLDPGRPKERLAIRRQLGFLPQHAGLYRNFSAFDLVDYVAVLKEISDRARRRVEVRRVLVAVGLEAEMHRRIRTLSGGMQRRVALAAALLGEPRLIVLDEPAAGLDPDQRLRLRHVLSDVGSRATVVMSTHQSDEVVALCRQVVVIERGRRLFDGTPAALTAVADGRVWVDDHPHPDALRSWVTGDGTVRSIGSPPPGAQIVSPTIDDGYLLLTNEIGAHA